ncbi:response regulator [Acutalibacter intestini]|uniref:response regulator n=1 Tax=Acutalibacter intestini TaxID=3093659 RepID=UPI002AC902AB|nr:response regulator [Acutalibacter sp. M00204]
MYQAFIVDDEETVRTGLENYFDWNKYGIEIIGDAEDGDIALEKILACRPDILICDVKMPHMDGTVLIEKLWEAGLRIPVLFVSGYSDVQMLKTAMRFHAEDYILKPVNFAELEEAILRIVTQLDGNRARKNELEKMEVLLYRSIPLLKEKYFLRLLGSRAKSVESTRRDLEFLGLDIDEEEPVNVFILRVTEYETFSSSEKEKYLYTFAVGNIVSELISQEWRGFVCQEDKEQLVGFVQGVDLELEGVTKFYERVRETIFDTLQIPVSIVAGTLGHGFMDLANSFQMALSVQRDQFIHGSGVYIATDAQKQEPADMNSMYHYLDGLHLDIGNYMEEGKIETEVEQIFIRLLSVDAIDEKDIKNFCFHFVQKIYTALSDQDTMDMKKQNETIGKIFRQTNVESLKKCLVSYFHGAVQNMWESQNKTYGNVTNQVKRLLQNEYAKQWTLDELAVQMNISKAYLCTLFKQSTGQTIMDYLSKIRIYKAADLLRDPKSKVNEVGDMVGYSDPGYFTRIFKKHFGISPSQYRKNLNI